MCQMANAWIKMCSKMMEEKAGVAVEFRERIRKKSACLHRGESFRGFVFHCSSVFEDDRPDSKSKLD